MTHSLNFCRKTVWRATPRKADRARDARKWSEAAELYDGYLKLRGSDASIWVQYGHALKESGKLDEAENAYEQSLVLSPMVADTHLQWGISASSSAITQALSQPTVKH